jgi:DNA-binding winged helix-turn-helix (wHTH) protein
VWTKAELLRDVWGFRALGATRTLDSHACRLRQKLSLRGDRFVINVWGVGYRLVDGEVSERAAAATAAALAVPPLPGPGEPVAPDADGGAEAS